MIKVSQYFTGHGMLGILFFIVGNVGCAWLVSDALLLTPGRSPSTGALLGMLVLGFAALISLPMMLIGREYDMKVTEIPRDLRRPSDQ